MAKLTRDEYWHGVRSLADSIVSEALKEVGLDASEDEAREKVKERLWKTCDGHRWVIYTAYNYQVLGHSNNDGYAVEHFGASSVVDDGALNTGALAFGALYGDVSELVWGSLFDEKWERESDEDDESESD